MLEVIVTAAKVIGHALLRGLPGLLAMDPRGDFIGRINAGGAPTAQYHALTANYEPSGGPGKLPCGGVGGHPKCE